MKTYGLLLLIMLFFLLAIPTFAQDTDGDNFPDGQDACPLLAAPNSNDGCPPDTPVPDRPADRDGDGLLDVHDQCPNDGGPAQNAGCPEGATPVPQSGDSDGDGFPDEQDPCPNQAGSAGGCDLVVIDDDGDCVAATEGGNRVNIREDANENAAIVGQLLPNQLKLITGITVSNNNPQTPSIWVNVDIGFINTGVIRIGGDCGDLVADEEGEPIMTATFELEYDCSTTPRVIIVSDDTPTWHHTGRISTYAPWWVYPDVLYRERPLPTEPDVIVPGNVIIGTPCDDLIIGTNEVDIIDGLGGNDMIVGLTGYDALVGNDGNDQLLGMTLPPLGGESTGNILVGGNGNDSLHAASNGIAERLDGGNDDDKLFGTPTDTLRGGNGNDYLTGSTTQIGGAGNDHLYGTSGDDRLFGNSGEDRIEASSGNDTIDGGDNRDFLFGHYGDDQINGGAGNDLIQTQLGNDTVHGGEGDDYIEFLWGGTDIGEGEGGNDRIDIRYLTFESFDIERAEWDIAIGVLTDATHFSGGTGNDIINDFHSFRDGFDIPIYGDDGDDQIRGAGRMYGGNGNDRFYVNNYGAVAYGGEGNDSFAAYPELNSPTLYYGEGGNDNFVGQRGVDLMFGGEGNDNIIGMGGADYLNGGNGDDHIQGGPNIVAGTLRSGYFDEPNYIDSGAGRDIVDGGPGNTNSDTCKVDGSDTVISCEITTWPATFVNLSFWQRFFDEFGI